MILRLAWRNLWRQPRRTILSLLSIAFAMGVMVWLLGLQQGVYGQMESNFMRIVQGYAQIQPRGYADDPDIDKTVPRPGALARRIGTLGLTASPRGSGYAILSSGTRSRGAMLLGVVPAAEARLSAIPTAVHEGRYLRDDDGAAIVIGKSLADNLHVQVGQPLTLLSTAKDGSVAADVLTVVGVFATGIGEIDRQFAELPLSRFQATFALGGDASLIAIGGPSLKAVDRRLPALRKLARAAGLDAQAWYELEPGLQQAIHLDASISVFWYATLLLVVVFIILNALLMAVLERTREFGMVLALGARHGLLGRVVWLELVLLVAMSAALGMSGGSAVVLWQAGHGFALPGGDALFRNRGLSGKMYPALNAFSLLTGPAAIGTSVMLSGLFPYLRIRRLEPVSAMRAV